MKQSDTAVTKTEPKKIRLKDLVTVDYTDDSWPEDENGQLVYDYWKRAAGVLDEEEELDEATSWYDGYMDKYTQSSYNPKDEILTLKWRHYDDYPKNVKIDKDTWMKMFKSQNFPREFNKLRKAGKIKFVGESLEEAIDWFKLVYGDSKLTIAKKIKATPSKTLEALTKPNPNAAGAQKFQHEFAVKELEYRKKINDHSDSNPKYKKDFGDGYSRLGESLEEAHDSQISKYELNGELKRVNARIKHLRSVHSGDALPKEVSTELSKLEDLRDSILAMLKEDEIMDDVDEGYITEALNMLQRMKRRAIMRKNKAKILAGRRRAQRRRASTSVIKQRALRAARASLARRLLHKDKGEASYGEKVRVEKMLATRQSSIKRIARKLVSRIRQKEQQRFQKHATPPKPIQSVKPNK